MYLVGFFAAMSGVLIITLNSFMNYPVGVQYINGQIIDTDPYAIFLHLYNLLKQVMEF